MLQLYDHFVKAQYDKLPLTSSGGPGCVTLSELRYLRPSEPQTALSLLQVQSSLSTPRRWYRLMLDVLKLIS